MSKSLPLNESKDIATSNSRDSRESRNPEDHEAATSKPPLPQGEGWGEGTAGILNNSLPPRRGKARMGVTEPLSSSLPLSESADETFRKSNNTDDKNIYDYGRNDPDPAIDYYFEPLNPEEQALFDYEARLESGDYPKRRSPERAATSTAVRLRRILRHTQADKGRRRPRRRTRPAQSPRRQIPQTGNPQPLTSASLPP